MQASAARAAQAQSVCGRLGCFISKTKEAPSAELTGPLVGKRLAVKDNICTLNTPTTCASRVLRSYQSPFEATCVRLLRQSGAHVVGKTNMDEFGMGSHSMHSSIGSPCVNVHGAGRSPGGSSGGSAVAVAACLADIALGTDTGGSVRLPASYCGVLGFKPSYGLISRFGVVPYANSLDTVGLLARDLALLRQSFDVLNVHDARDPTSLQLQERKRSRDEDSLKKRRLRVGIPAEFNVQELRPEVLHMWRHTTTCLDRIGCDVVPVSLPSMSAALPAYYAIAAAEASSNLAKYRGVVYGGEDKNSLEDGDPIEELRARDFGPEVQRRILSGAYTLMSDNVDNYFIQAQKIRALIKSEFDQVFARASIVENASESEGVDVLLAPTAVSGAPELQAVQKAQSESSVVEWANDVLTVPASLAGLPAMSVPVAHDEDGMPLGMQVIGQHGDDVAVLFAAELLANL